MNSNEWGLAQVFDERVEFYRKECILYILMLP